MFLRKYDDTCILRRAGRSVVAYVYIYIADYKLILNSHFQQFQQVQTVMPALLLHLAKYSTGVKTKNLLVITFLVHSSFIIDGTVDLVA